VIYVLQLQHQFQEALIKGLGTVEPEHVIHLNGLEYARIYNVIDFTIEEGEAQLLFQD
jgi:hypothetical protein